MAEAAEWIMKILRFSFVFCLLLEIISRVFYGDGRCVGIPYGVDRNFAFFVCWGFIYSIICVIKGQDGRNS